MFHTLRRWFGQNATHAKRRKLPSSRRRTRLLCLEELESRLTPSGYNISTVAGNHTQGYGGDGGTAVRAELYYPAGVAVDAVGDLFIADAQNNVVREVNAATLTITTVAGNHTAGYAGDGGPAGSAELYGPSGVAVDAAGDLFIADFNNDVVREVSAATGKISTVAGNHTAGYSGDGGPAGSAALNGPVGVAVDAAGDLFIADARNNVVREVSAATGKISTVAGNGAAGYGGDGGPAASAELYYPTGVALDGVGNLFIADEFNNVVREVSAATGKIGTVAGNHTAGYGGDGGPAANAQLDGPFGVAVDGGGNLFISDDVNQVIREVSAATGKISTIAGQFYNGHGSGFYSGDGGPAVDAQLYYPEGIALAASGALFIGDSNNNVVRMLSPASYAVSEYPGAGVWGRASSSSSGNWQQLTTADASLLANDANGDVAAEFPGAGVWLYTAAAAGWKQLTPGNASLLAMDANGDVAAEFPGAGLWQYTAAVWKQLSTVDASLLAIDPAGDVFAEFPGAGVWRYTAAAGFRQLTTAAAALLATDAAGDVAAEFSGAGVWRYTASSGEWRQLTTANASLLVMDAGGDVAAEFSGSGVWLDTAAAGWRQVTAGDAGSLGIDDAGEVVAAIPGYGVYLYYTGLYEFGPGYALLSPAYPALLSAR